MPAGRSVRHTPTPEEIAEICAEIRSEWNETQWARQPGYLVDSWRPPCVPDLFDLTHRESFS